MLGMLVLMVGAQMYQKYFSTEEQSVRLREYVEGREHPSDHKDSLHINSLYEKFRRIYDTIDTFDFDTLMEFNSVNKAELPADFQAKMMTYEFLDLLFGEPSLSAQTREQRSTAHHAVTNGIQRINVSLGNDFTWNMYDHDFHGGFASDVKYMFKEKYIMVLVTLEMTKPEIFADGTDNFYEGSFHGGVLVFDINTLKNVAYVQFVTGNSEEVNAGPYKEEKLNAILLQDMEGNIITRSNDASITVFGRRLAF